MDTIIACGSCIITVASSYLMLADASSVANQMELQKFLLALIGAVLGSGACMMFNPQVEFRKIIIGRGIVALLAGVLCPSILGVIHPALDAIAMRPPVLVALSVGFASAGYIVSRAFFARWYASADRQAQALADAAERKWLPPLQRELHQNTLATQANTAQRLSSAQAEEIQPKPVYLADASTGAPLSAQPVIVKQPVQ